MLPMIGSLKYLTLVGFNRGEDQADEEQHPNEPDQQPDQPNQQSDQRAGTAAARRGHRRRANAKDDSQNRRKDRQHGHDNEVCDTEQYRLHRMKAKKLIFLFDQEKDQSHDPDVRNSRRYFRVQAAVSWKLVLVGRVEGSALLNSPDSAVSKS